MGGMRNCLIAISIASFALAASTVPRRKANRVRLLIRSTDHRGI